MFTITRDQNYFLHLPRNYLTFTTGALHLGTFHICFPEIENSQHRNKEQKKRKLRVLRSITLLIICERMRSILMTFNDNDSILWKV